MGTNLAPVRLADEEDLCIGPLRVRPALRVVEAHNGSEQRIEPRVMQLLIVLARNEGAVVSREQLIAACWDGRVVSDDAVNSCVAKARRIGDAYRAFSIESVPRVGYRLSKNGPSANRIVSGKPRRARLQISLAAVLVAIVGGWWLIETASYRDASSRFAVMPVAAIDNDPASREIAAGLAEQVAAALNDYYLEVEIWDDPDLAEGIESAASHAIRLTTYVEGGMPHVRASLEDLTGGGLLWSQDFARAASAAHSLNKEVAARVAVVAEMAASLRVEGLRSRDTKALAMVIDGYDRFFATDQRYIEDIVALLERVTENAPDFARGHALYGNMLLASSLNLPDDEFLAVREKARLALERAFLLAPDDPQLRVGLAGLTKGTEWSEREAIFRRGLSSTSDNTTSSLVYGRFLLTAGYLAEGLQEQRRALGLDRFGQGPTWWIGSALYLNGEVDKAMSWLDDFLELQPDHVNARRARFMITALERPPEESRALLADPRGRPLDLDEPLERIFSAYLTARESGTVKDKETAIDVIMTRWPDYVSGQAGVVLAGRLGNLDAAFALATDYANDQRTTRESYHFIPLFLFGPATESMRRDARFIPLMEQLGLLDYWRATNKWPDFCDAEPESVCPQMRSIPIESVASSAYRQ